MRANVQDQMSAPMCRCRAHDKEREVPIGAAGGPFGPVGGRQVAGMVPAMVPVGTGDGGGWNG